MRSQVDTENHVEHASDSHVKGETHIRSAKPVSSCMKPNSKVRSQWQVETHI